MSKIEMERIDGVFGYKVLLPELITNKALTQWSESFMRKIIEESISNYSLLVDSNTHQFESVECVKLLREVLGYLAANTNGLKTVAFVRPREYGGKSIVSSNEGYFNNCSDALSWLKQNE